MAITIEEGLVSHLLADVSLKNKIDDRLYPMYLPQSSALPAITYTRVSTPRIQTHDQTPYGLAYPRFQFDIYAESFEEVVNLTELLRIQLLGFSGEFGTVEKIKVHGILHELEQDVFEAETGMYRKMIDYSIRHQE